MRKIGMRLCIMTLVVLFSASAIYAEMAKAGSGPYRGGKSGTIAAMKMGEAVFS